MPRVHPFILLTLILHIIYLSTTKSLADPFLKERSPIFNIPNFREKGGSNSRTTPNSPSSTDVSLVYQGNVVAEVTTKVRTMGHSTIYGGKPTNTEKPSIGDKSSGSKGAKTGGGKEGLEVLLRAVAGIIIFLKLL